MGTIMVIRCNKLHKLDIPPTTMAYDGYITQKKSWNCTIVKVGWITMMVALPVAAWVAE